MLSDTARKEEGLQHTPVSASGHQYHMVELRCFTSLLAYCPWQPHACSDAFHACLFFMLKMKKGAPNKLRNGSFCCCQLCIISHLKRSKLLLSITLRWQILSSYTTRECNSRPPPMQTLLALVWPAQLLPVAENALVGSEQTITIRYNFWSASVNDRSTTSYQAYLNNWA